MRKEHYPLTLCLIVLPLLACGQAYDSYFIGSPIDQIATPEGGICLMGGASEDDNAMRWFLDRANGGDVLVLRASGSDGYNNYLFNELGVTVNSVETIVFNNALASEDPYVLQKVKQAEAIWLAGGDQWDYISYWRGSSIDSLINEGISARNVAIGGTSAGMAIQGKFYFSAENGTITSPAALANPFDNNVTVDSFPFIKNQHLQDVITDTHFDNPDRKGRSVVFLSRILIDYGIAAKVIACDEYTAVCIDNNGIAKVYGQHPDYDDNAFFIQTNCALSSVVPEDCSAGNPLDWNLGGMALSVYSVKGTSSGSNTFDLRDWKTGNGGTWEHWYVDNGVLYQEIGIEPDCSVSSVPTIDKTSIKLYPNPADDFINVHLSELSKTTESMQLINSFGQVVWHCDKPTREIRINIRELSEGLYYLQFSLEHGAWVHRKILIH